MLVARALPEEHDAVLDIAASAGIALDVPGELARPWALLLTARDSGDEPPHAFLLAWTVADEIELLQIATLPQRRRSGSATALLEALCAHARQHGVCAILLEVRQSNTAAIALYEKFGFRRVRLRREYYRAPTEDALEMALALGAKSTHAS